MITLQFEGVTMQLKLKCTPLSVILPWLCFEWANEIAQGAVDTTYNIFINPKRKVAWPMVEAGYAAWLW